ncbi:hypothetical protein [Methylorubrum aminovorans]|uniref:hypothetical protein n=1 Tax=Methylorubrum aminovorans TaxID=269069 RepID=UPI0024E0A712|nr:hypothetical protein [Methylorubrum aminovorans]
MPSAPLDVRGGPGIRIERNNTSTIVSLSDVVLVTSGTGPDFIVSSPEGKIRLFDGLSLLLRMDRTGPNGPTLSVDGSPRAQWRDANGSPLADGVIQKDSLQRVVYDGTRGIWLGTQLGGPGTTGVTPDFTGTLGQRGAHDKAPKAQPSLRSQICRPVRNGRSMPSSPTASAIGRLGSRSRRAPRRPP